MFTKYILAETDSLPPIEPTSMYEFVIAGNGVFVRARRRELEALIPVSRCEIRGLRPVHPYVRMEAGKVPLVCTQAILAEFQRDLPQRIAHLAKAGRRNVESNQTQAGER